MTSVASSKTTSPRGDDLPEDLRQHLLSIGVLDLPKPKTTPKPVADYVAWKPSFKGEEPPF